MMSSFIRVLLRPALWILLYGGMIGYGVYALVNIPVEVLPAFNFPAISVITHLPGTTATSMETLVATPLEGQLLGLPDVTQVRSAIGDGVVETDLRFRAGTDPNADLQAVNGAIDRVRASLPPAAQPLSEIMGNAINEVADYALQIPAGVPHEEVSRVVAATIVPALRAISGVQLVDSAGIGDAALWVQPDLNALRQAHIPVSALTAALAGQVSLAPGGYLTLGHQDSLIELHNLPTRIADLNATLVAGPNGPVALGSLARIIHATLPTHQRELLDGQPSIALTIFKQQGASTLPVTQAIARRLAALRGQLPPGVRFIRIYDQGHLVHAVGADLRRNLIIGGVLAIAVMLFVLGARSGAWLLALSIPVSLLLGIAGLYAAGQSLNLMTLGAITVALGLVADDAIIVLESICHRWEAGDAPAAGVLRGLRDIAAPDIIGTLTTILVFVPLLFTGGLAGLFFIPFALGMVFSLLASLLVSLTLIPLGLSLVRHGGAIPQPSRRSEQLLAALRRHNRRLFNFVLRHPRWAIGGCFLLLLVSLAAMSLVSVNILPLPNEGVLLESFTLPPGTALLDTQAAVNSIVTRINANPAVAHSLARIGSAAGSNYTEPAYAGEIEILLKPGAGANSLDAIAAQILAASQTPSVQLGVDTPTVERLGESLSGLPQPFEIQLYGTKFAEMATLADAITSRLDKVNGLSGVFNNDGYPETQINVQPRPAALAAAGLTPAQLSHELAALLAGQVVARVPDGNIALPVYIRLPDPAAFSLNDLAALPVGSQSGTPLGQLASISLVTSPNQFHHIDGARAFDILATPTTAPGTAIAAAKRALASLKLPPDYRIAFGGLYPMLERAVLGLGIASLAAVILMAGVLVLRFGGRRAPGLLMMQIPLAMTGGALALAASGLGLNGIGLVGFLTLVGVSLNHGIVLLDRAQQNENAGLAPAQAMEEALNVRFRPIFLTTVVAVLGMLPTALGFGAGAAPEQGLAVVIAGGIVWSALLSTNLIPALYIRYRGK
ncbi:efflux RND transporter permease subunit [Acidocella sp.]|uniref:efflux RND transporter permease subunit n=1 Tax=Acidocella sp. TaxID=50710 RepID=UPI0025C407FB|nr:efflux RND transporter permease subunit [Acidocella sp.]